MLESDIKVIHSVPEMVDWVGAYGPDQQLLRIAPLFKPQVSVTSKGCILLVDLARDISLATNYKGGRLSIPNMHTLDSHINMHFGINLNHLLGKPIGTANSRVIATHLTKVLRANHLDLSKHINSDKSRIRYKSISTLKKIDPSIRFPTLANLADWLGITYTDTETVLIAK